MKKTLTKHLWVLLAAIMVTFSSTGMNGQTNPNSQHKSDYVPDSETAIKIAEAIWLPIYGNKIYEHKPFVAELMNDSIWVVKGTLKTRKGGVPYIEIKKSDCKILKVTHGK